MTVKSPLIIGAGHGWCATSPLHLTLQCSNNCSHTGLLKEDHLLYNVYSKDAWAWRKPWYDRLVNDCMTPKWKYPYGYQNQYGYHNHLEEIKELFKEPTLETYIKYYTRHYERVRHKFTFVHDFSNSNALLPRSFLQKVAPKLKKHFKIKVLMIFRDPVRRLYSELSHQWQKSEKLQENYSTTKEYFRSYLNIGQITPNSNYVKTFKSYNSLFSTFPIVSEHFWGGTNDQVAKLSDFLQFDIQNIWPNCYYPEMGTRAPKHEYLQDQWSSDMEDLTEDDLSYGRKYLSKYYDDWYKCFGSMPWIY